MLASITPLGERGRRSKWSVTVTAFVLSALAGGVTIGLLAGALGGLVLPSEVGARGRLAVLAVAAALALALDAGGRAVPGPRRQVNEQWLRAYRGWVYGGGFGAQMGLGVTTIITSAATYVGLVAAFLTGDPARGAAVMGCYGALRGLTSLLAARVDRPARLMALHARLAAWRAPVARAALAALGAILALALVGSMA
jgi:hypothetical protein